MGPDRELGVGLMGLGVVGGGVADALLDPIRPLRSVAASGLKLKKVLVRDISKPRSKSVPTSLLTTDPGDILDDPNINLVVEVMGGENPAAGYIRRAVSDGKHVVTANKEVMAKHGPELISLAASKKVNLLFEAAVGGGIPIIGPLTKDLLANDISSIHAIINGTTNYVLTRMAGEGIGFSEALEEAQALGYAEADPSDDIEGTDAAYKLAVLATLAFHTRVHSDDVYREGISRLEAKDFLYARELGYAIKLLAIARGGPDSVQVRVHPTMVPQDHMLANVDGVFNAVEAEGHLTGRVLFHGRGAGREPTTSAVIGDLVETARRIRSGSVPAAAVELEASRTVAPMSSLTSKYYLRLNVADTPGVLAQIAGIFGDLNISIASVLQKDFDPAAQTAEIVVTTHPANEAAMQRSLAMIQGLGVVRRIDNMIRIEYWPGT